MIQKLTLVRVIRVIGLYKVIFFSDASHQFWLVHIMAPKFGIKFEVMIKSQSYALVILVLDDCLVKTASTIRAAQ